ncbi:MAG: T9SS type A sorting domain-containing protein [Salinivirgaceae bacterium]|nr:T9SS type A sorting domain-containing protein [Salinivirgaceae bacterium]
MNKNILHNFLLGLFVMLISAVSVMGQGKTYVSVNATAADWHNLSTWKENGTGGNPASSAAFLDKTNSFVVATEVTIGDTASMLNLTVAAGGKLYFGKEGGTNKGIYVDGTFTVEAASAEKEEGLASVSSVIGTRILTVKGAFTNNGQMVFRNGTGRTVNVMFVGGQNVTVNETADKTVFNNFIVASATVKTNSNLDIDGSLSIISGGIFDTNGKTINIGGNFSNSGTFTRRKSTVVFDGRAVQTITGATDFYSVNVVGGGFLVVASNINVYGDFLVDGNSTVSSSAKLVFYRNFTIKSGSKYDTNTEHTGFWGGYKDNGTNNQTITVEGEATFNRLLINAKGSGDFGVKTFYGNINATSYIYIYPGAKLIDASVNYQHTFLGAAVRGEMDLKSPMTIKGGTLRKKETDNDTYGSFSIGSGDITIPSGTVYVKAGDTFNALGNVKVLTGAEFVLSGDELLQAEIIGLDSKTFTVENGANLYLRGANDNFPKGFGSVVLEETSKTIYDRSFVQKVHGGSGVTYGILQLDKSDKEFNGGATIAYHLNVYAPTNGTINVDMKNYDFTIGYHIQDYPDRRGTTNIHSEGTITMKSRGNRSQYIYKRDNGTYDFKNLIFATDDPTYSQTKYITGDINVSGAVTLTNASDNEQLFLALDIDDHNIIGAETEANVFTLGSNTRLKVSGHNNFGQTISKFPTVEIDPNSIVQFDATTTDQIIPNTTYGNIYLYGSTAKIVETTVTIAGWINQNGGTPKLTMDDGITMYIEGDWKLGASYLNINRGAKVIFNGANQEIVATTLPNVEIRGSNTKTLKGNLVVEGDLSIYTGSELNADNRTISLYGNFNNNDASGRYSQRYGRLNMRGDGYTTSISCANTTNTTFNHIYIEKSIGDTVHFLTKTFVGGNLMTGSNRGSIDIFNDTIIIGGDLYMYPNCELIHGSEAVLYFNSTDAEQTISNQHTINNYPTMRFSGGAVKRLVSNAFDINGDVIIERDAIVTSSYKLNVSGDWRNNSGTFNHSSEVEFDGGDGQKISGSAFCNVTFGGTGTKYLGGIINVSGWLKIDSLATFDVGPEDEDAYYDITVGSHWYNNIVSPDRSKTGRFNPRRGTVTFLGSSTDIYTGDTLQPNGEGISGKGFYNVVINTSDPANYKRLYPIHGDNSKIKTGPNDMHVAHDFTINSGIFYTYWNELFVGGNLKNLGGNFSMNGHYSAVTKLYLGGGPGDYEFDPGESNTVRHIEINNGGTYYLMNDYLQYGHSFDYGKDSLIHIRKGTLDMNHHSITFVEPGNVFVNTEGNLKLDSAAVLAMYSGRKLINRGRLELIGHANSQAKIQPGASGWYYYIIQDKGSGVLAADQYCIEGTQGDGLNIQKGSIDSSHKLENGIFSNSTGSALLTIGKDVNVGDGTWEIKNVSFNAREGKPTANVTRSDGNKKITFVDYNGTLAGEAKDNDPKDLVDWKMSEGVFWTGKAKDSDWFNALNWKSGSVPTEDKSVILDHTEITNKDSACTIIINKRVKIKNLTIDDKMTLELRGNDDLDIDGLEVDGKLTMLGGSTLRQMNARDSLILHGSWACSGTYTPNNVPTIFVPTAGTHQLIVSSGQKLAAMVVHSMGGYLALQGVINVKDSVRLETGTLIGNNAQINLEGDWTPAGGMFEMGESIVNFCGSTGEQFIHGGSFWRIFFANGAKKTIDEDISVDRDFKIQSSSGLVDAGAKNIYMSGRTTYWYNYANAEIFDQSGDGSVIFSGGTSYIGSVEYDKTITTKKISKPTTFNNMLLQGSGTKSFRDTSFLKGAIEMVAGIDVSISRTGAIIGDENANPSFTSYGGAFLIYGEDNFPKKMNLVELVGGTVYYRDSTFNQVIFPTQYSSLSLYNYYWTTDGAWRRVTKTLGGDITVTGSISIGDTVTTLVVGDNRKIFLTGSISLATDGKQIDWGTGSLYHVGAGWSVDADINTFNNIYKQGTGTLTANSEWTVTGDMEFEPETQFQMNANKVIGTTGKHFKMGLNCQLHSSVPRGNSEEGDVAFPTGFSSYELDPTTKTYLRAAGDQKLFSGVDYGMVYLYSSAVRNVEFGGTIKVMNDFYNSYDGTTIIDNGHDLELYGATNDLRNYLPTSTLYLKADGDQKVYAGGGFTLLTLKNLTLQGTGVKEIDETTVRISGDIEVGANTTFSCNDATEFSGERITNHGKFRHYGNTFTFNRGRKQTIDMGADNIFNGLSLTEEDTVDIVGGGISVNTGVFSLGEKAQLDMGSYTHNIASSRIDLGADCNWITENANFIFNRGGAQTIPALECKDIRFSTSGTKTLEGNLTVDSLIIDEGTGFSVGSDATHYKVTVYGDWICNGSFTSRSDSVLFESKPDYDNTNRKIKSNGQAFNIAVFNRNSNAISTFNIQDPMTIKDSMVICDKATFCLNHNTLTIGDDDANFTDAPFYPDGERLNVKYGGTLDINAGASLQFNHMDLNTHLDVWGTLKMVGSTSANAIITRSSTYYDTRGTEVTIHSGATLYAKNYQVQYLAPTGFVVEYGVNVDYDANLSNGIWSNMYTGKSHDRPDGSTPAIKSFIYLTLNAEMANPFISNLAFNHGGAPSIRCHYNIRRDETIVEQEITLSGINGALGIEDYEFNKYALSDITFSNPRHHKINWPEVTQIVWTGAVSEDWFDKNNWRPNTSAPTKDLSVRIPRAANAPIIYKEGAVCKNLTITNGSLTVENFTKEDNSKPSLKIEGSVDVQAGGVFAIEDTANIAVYGDWSIASTGSFVPQKGSVSFAAGGGSVSIVPNKSEFNNVSFDGGATYMITGTEIKVNGKFEINDGIVWPCTPNYIYTIKGNYYRDAENGTFNRNILGFVKFAGGNQNITNGLFSRVRFSGAGDKNLKSSFDGSYVSSSSTARGFIVENGATLKAECPLTIKGNVLIEAGSTFVDCNLTHTFTGYYWEAPGTYSGLGKVKFDVGHHQYINGANFHDLEMKSNANMYTRYINGDVTLTGDLTTSYCYLDMLVNNITSEEGTFTMGEKAYVYARGENNYPNFANYEVSETAYSYYNGPMNQTIRAANYGYLYLQSNTVKTLAGDIFVDKNLVISENGGTLTTANHNIYLGGHWYNQYNGTFIPGTGRVIFNGISGNQYAYLGLTVENPFYDIEVRKPDGQLFYGASVDLVLDGSLYVTSGTMSCVGGYKVKIDGEMLVSGSGVINSTGCYELRRPDGDCKIQTNGSTLNDLIINGDATFKLNDDITVYGNFTLQKGTFSQEGHTATLGNSLDNAIIYGTYQVTPGGKLRIGSSSSFVVKDGGKVEVVGSSTNYAQVTNNTDRYYFTVENGGTIAAQYYSFSYLAKQGIIISDGATIDRRKNFSNGIFSNVVSAGVCLDIRNDQEMKGEGVATGRIENISFPTNPGGGAVNIRKVESTEGEIEVYDATGMLAGELYENDPHNLISWTGDIEYFWTGAAGDDDWRNSGNWIAKRNGVEIEAVYPTADNNVTIQKVAGGRKYPVIKKDSAFTKRLTIVDGAKLTIDVSEDEENLRCAVVAYSDVTVNGKLIMTSTRDTLNVYGNWVVGTRGTLTAGDGNVRMSGVGVKTIQNRVQSFNNLEIDNAGTVQSQSAMKVDGDFVITQGTFDVTSYDVTVGGDFVCNGTFMPQTRTIFLKGNGKTLGDVHNFNPGSSTYYNITLSKGKYTLTGNDLFINHNFDVAAGEFVVANKSVNMGDGTGADILSVSGGTIRFGENGKLKMGNGATIYETGGRFEMVGSRNNEAVVTSQKVTGTYAFTVAGGTIAANNYKVERINASGVHLLADAQIDGTNNFSNGQFVSGVTGGQYLWLENNFGVANTDTVIMNKVYFNAGPRYNIKRSDSGTNGVVKALDAVGVVASYYFEKEDGDAKTANTGAIVWAYTGDVLYWEGAHPSGNDSDGTRWDNPFNWNNMRGGEPGSGGFPSEDTRVFINKQDHGKYPIIYSNNHDRVAKAKGIDIYKDASLTQQSGVILEVNNPEAGMSIGDNATFNAKDTVVIKGQFANAGTFNHGGSSTVVWESGLNRNIEMNGCAFYNFSVKNEDGAAVTFAVERGKSLVVANNFTIVGGTVDCNGGTLDIGGNFSKEGGSFVHNKGTVRMNGTKNQAISSDEPLTFNNLELIGTKTDTIKIDIEIEGNIVVGTKVCAPSADIVCRGNWTRPLGGSQKNNFNGGSGVVKFAGTKTQNIEKPETFTKVEINNSASSALMTTYKQSISQSLTLERGILTGNSANPIHLAADATVSGAKPSSYVNGAVEKVKNSEEDFIFPIGGNDRYAPLAINTTAAGGTYCAVYKSNAPDNSKQLGANVNTISSKEYWTLTGSGEKPKVSLYWRDRNFSGLTDFDVLSVVVYNNTWNRQGEGGKSHIVPFAVGDTTKGHIFTDVAIEAFGKLTFGFTYPTIIWKDNAVSDVYVDRTNWIGERYTPSKTTNIVVETIGAGKNHPVVSGTGDCFDMTINAGGIIEVVSGATLTVHGNAKIDGTLILGENAKINFSKNVDAGNAEVQAAANSCVYINGKTNQNVKIDSCYNIVFSNKDFAEKSYADRDHEFDKTLECDIKVNGNLKVNDYITLKTGSHNITVLGNLQIDANAGLNGTSTFVMNGSSQQTISISPHSPVYNLTINNSCEDKPQVKLATDITVKGKLTLTRGILQSKSASTPGCLILEKDATTVGCSNESYVIGVMQKNGKKDFTFPIGTTNRLAQIGITGLTGEAYITAEYSFAKPISVLNLAPEVQKVSCIEAWNLGNTGSNEAYITLYFNDIESSEIGELSSLLVVANTGGRWESLGLNASSSTMEDGKVVIKSNAKATIAGSSTPRSLRQTTRRTLNASTPHALAASGAVVTAGTTNPIINPLPIELFSFTAEAVANNDVRLDWSTASEHNNAYFTIEHTFNGVTEMVAEVAAQGGAGEGADYSYLHINQPVGTHYYRLHQTDIDGTTTIASEWVAVVVEDANQPQLMMGIVPNPGKCENIKVSVSGISGGKFRYVVADMSGQSLIDRTINTAESTSYQIDATDWNLQPSVYLIKVFTDNGQTVSKFVVE